ncbi:hypothetical protein T439DRAFT_355147 [Meredithblackwellia eburnea MCA 4105]
MSDPFETSTWALHVNLSSFLLGTGFAVLMLGIILAQTATYLTRSHRREPYLQSLVLFLVFINILENVTGVAGILVVFVLKYGDMSALEVLNGWTKACMLLSVVPGLFCQFWLEYRVYVISRRNKWVPTVMTVPVLTSTVFSIISMVYRKAARLTVLLPLGLAWIAATDFTLSASFCIFVYLDATKVLSGDFRERLLHMASIAIQACVPTATCAIITLVLSRALPQVTVYMAFFVPLGPLYLFSLLYTLNSRDTLEDHTVNTSGNGGSSSIGGGNGLKPPRAFRVSTLHGQSQIASWNGNIEGEDGEGLRDTHFPMQVRLAEVDLQSLEKP